MTSPATEDLYFLAVFNGEDETHYSTLQAAMAFGESIVGCTGRILLVGGGDGDVPLMEYVNGQVTGLVE